MLSEVKFSVSLQLHEESAVLIAIAVVVWGSKDLESFVQNFFIALAIEDWLGLHELTEETAE